MELFYTLAALLLFTSFYVQGEILVTSPPVNTGGKIGDIVQVNCSTVLTNLQTMSWTFNGAGSTADQTIVTATANDLLWEQWAKDIFTMDAQRNLIISNFSHDRAGKYTCQISQVSPIENKLFPAEIMALGDLALDSRDVFAGEETTVTCAINISGLYNPRLRIFRLDEEVQTYTISQPVAPDGEFRLLKYGYNFTTTSEDNDIEFRCDLIFTAYVQNPAYRDLAYFNITVYHGVMDIEITPNSDNSIPTVEVGDFLNCSARGEPEPEFFWTDVANSTSDTRNGSSLLVTFDMIGRNQFMCTAYNYVNETYYDVTKTVTFQAVEAGTSGSQIVLPSSVFSIALALLLTMTS